MKLTHAMNISEWTEVYTLIQPNLVKHVILMGLSAIWMFYKENQFIYFNILKYNFSSKWQEIVDVTLFICGR
jgi:hypothetical protein